MIADTARIAKTATEGLRLLWEDGWLSDWRQTGPVIEELAKRGNHFSSGELGMALKRANYLTRRGNRGRFEFIQKFPYQVDETNAEGKKASSR